jgi:hypothetical protein
MLLGAIIGFLAGVLLGMGGQNDWSAILWRSTLGALVVGVLLRWWGQRWVQCLREAQHERLAELMAQRKEAKNAPTKRV